MLPTTARIVPMVLRIGFFVSGLFFSVDSMPVKVREILFYNPLCHVIELMRSGFSAGYADNFISLPYLAAVTLVALALGLLLERYSRNYLDRA